MDAVREAVENWDGGELSIDLVVDRVAPDVTAEELSLVKDVLARPQPIIPPPHTPEPSMWKTAAP